MRVLHTSDWHLGKRLAGFSRAQEHAAFVDELCLVAREVDLVLVTGDVFDVYNPPIDAEELFFDAMARLGDGGRRAVVLIAGNHDSPERLAASAPLAVNHGVFLFGSPGDSAVVRGCKVAASAPGPNQLVLDLGCGERAAIAALPYASERRLGTALTDPGDVADRRAVFASAMRRAFAERARVFRPDTVNLVLAHASVEGCVTSESERPLVGGATDLPADVFPAAAQYVALGHIHLAQEVAPGRRYAGAPLAFRMSERGYRHTHTIVEVTAGAHPRIEEVPIDAGRPLVRWEVSSVVEVCRRVDGGEHAGALIELILDSAIPPTHADVARIKALPRDFVAIRVKEPAASERQETLPPPDASLAALFRAYFRDQRAAEPGDDLVDLFVELATEAAATQPTEPDVTANPTTASEAA